MSTQVTLHIYSGRPDPTWELSDSEVDQLSTRLKSIDKTTLMKPPGIYGGLGYRGFSIFSSRDSRLERLTYVDHGIVDQERLSVNLDSGDRSLEKWLLSTSGSTIDPKAYEYVEAEISKRDLISFPGFLIPVYDPGRWNNDPTTLRSNNCYNYANDKITNTFAQPGRGSGRPWSQLVSCDIDVSPSAQRDGQIPIANPDVTPAEGHIIALVMGVGYDYHWYRRDKTGLWSHKPGQTQARNVDNSGNPINDPRTCDRGPYQIFCGFFQCIPARTRIN